MTSTLGKVAAVGAAAAIVVAGAVGIVTQADNNPTATPAAVATPTFQATFDNATDFAAQFDSGYSGENPYDWPAGQQFLAWLGDHDSTCAGPTTSRTVAFSGNQQALNFSQLFYHCAPGSAGTGHLMTAVNTVGYDIAWFSPKTAYTGITKVCWDINETTMSRRKWTQIAFVNSADAKKYPAGQPTSSPVNKQARGTGGFDLGFTSPEFQDPNGSTTGILSAGTSGFKTQTGGTIEWWENGAFKTQDFNKPIPPNQDKATRYTQCIEQTAPGTITFTQAMPTGNRAVSFAGTIPTDARRVVFEDDNYNPPKDDPALGQGGTYDANFLTWHWDNIQIFTTAGGPPPTTTVPSTIPPTSVPPTSAPNTTATPTTIPSTTTVKPSTTTVPGTTTSTVPACPLSFAADAQKWCADIMVRLHALDGK